MKFTITPYLKSARRLTAICALVATPLFSSCSGDASMEWRSDELAELAQPLFGSIEPPSLLALYARDYTVPIYNDAFNGSCTGTQIRPNIVVTARHCVTIDGETDGPFATPNEILIGQRGSTDYFSTLTSPTTGNFLNQASCLASTSCSTVSLIYSGGFIQDLVWIYMNPSEPRNLDDRDVFVPMIPASVGDTIVVAGHGVYNPFLPADPGNGFLHYGQFDVESLSGAPIESAGGFTVVVSGDATNDALQGGDSGAGYWLGTNPPGIVGIHSGGPACEFGENCLEGRGTHAAVMNPTLDGHEQDILPGVGAGDWEFSTSSELNDFELITTGGNPNWSLGGGLYMVTSNVGANMQVAHSSMGTGCASTRIRATDNDVSGIVFNYQDADHYYTFQASDQGNYRRITQTIGTNTTILAEESWSGTWISNTYLTVCTRSGFAIQAWINPGTSGELHMSVTDQGASAVRGGRVGIFNHYNRYARHSYLRTFSLPEAISMVNTYQAM